MTDLDPTTFRPETKALHSGQKPDSATNARAIGLGSSGVNDMPM